MSEIIQGSFNLEFDNDHMLVNTIIINDHYVPVIGKRLTINDHDLYFCYIIGQHAYLMLENDVKPFSNFKFTDFADLTQTVGQKAIENEIEHLLTGTSSQIDPPKNKPPKVMWSNDEVDQKQLNKIYQLQKQFGKFSQE